MSENELLGISKRPEIETEGVFDPELEKSEFISEMESMIGDPVATMIKPLLTQYFNAIMPKPPEPIKTEHKVKIFWLHRSCKIEEIEQIELMIEDLLNDGYCCHLPTIVGDFVIMDFSRRKETEENETQTKTPQS